MITLSDDTNEAKLGDEAPKRRRLSDVVNSTYAYPEEDRTRIAPYATQSTGVRLRKGFEDSMRQVLYTPQGLEIMYGQAQMTIGDWAGNDKLIERGKSLIQSATNEIEQTELEAERNGFAFSPEDYKSFSYALGGGAANYGVMLASAYASGGLSKLFGATAEMAGATAEVTGLGSNFLFEAVGHNQKALDRYKQTTGDTELKNYNSEEGKKALATSLIYGTGSTILEKYMGFGQQRKMFEKPTEFLKQTALISASEGTTEFSQSLLEMGIDLGAGTINWQDVPDELREAFLEGAVGAVLGGGAGVASGLANRAKVKNAIKDQIKGTVSEAKVDVIADEIYDSANAELSNVIAKELKYDTELRNKRGDIYYSAMGAIEQELKYKPFYQAMTEDDRASYLNTAASHFADQVLAEANFRGVLIDDVLKSSDIVYDKGIRISRNIDLVAALKKRNLYPKQMKEKRMSLNAFLKWKGGVIDKGGDLKSRGAIKEYPGLINNKSGMNLDDATLMAWENGYLSGNERPEINDLLDAIDEELRGNKRYNTEEQLTLDDHLADLEKNLDRMGIDWQNMTPNEIDEAIKQYDDPEYQSLMREAEFYEWHELVEPNSEPDIENNPFIDPDAPKEKRTIFEEENPNDPFALVDEYFQLADEMERLDEINPAYEGETINIGGKERTVYNSDGKRIAQSKEALENFYKWFGDSKVVDEQGRPKVMYHGTPNAIYDTLRAGTYFTDNKSYAEVYKSQGASSISYKKEAVKPDVYAVYIKMEKPFDTRNKEARDDFYKYYYQQMGMGTDLSEMGLPDWTDVRDLLEFITEYHPELGYDGILLDEGGVGGYGEDVKSRGISYVNISPNQIKSTSNRGTYSESENIYYQSAFHGTPLNELEGGKFKLEKNGGKDAKGSTQVTPDEYIIKLLEDADESTLPHEFAHYWLSEMWNYVRSGRASESYTNRWNTIADYLGVSPEQTMLRRDQQELFASSYEAYLTRGKLPTPMIKTAFDDYDKWLQKVYNDYNKITYQSRFGRRRVRLTDGAIKFFQSMTTGTLDAPTLAPKDTGVKLETEPKMPEFTEREVVEEPTYSKTTTITKGNAPLRETTTITNVKGERGESSVYSRAVRLHPEAVSQPGLSYDKIHLDEQALGAKELVENDINKARAIIDGSQAETGGLTRTAIMFAYEQEMLRIGNNDEFDRVRKLHSLEQTRRGQEIASERLETDDVTNPSYWLEIAERNQAQSVANKLFKGKERTKQLEETIKSETEKLVSELKGKTIAEQQEVYRKTAERLKKEYGLDTLYQMPSDAKEQTVNEFIKDTFGLNLETDERNDIINKSEQLQKLWKNTVAVGGNPSVEAMRAKRELNNMIQAKNPSNALAIWTSIFGRGIMLTSVKSPVLNIISNIEAGLTEAVVRRTVYKANEKSVDPKVKEEFAKYAWEVYKASGDIVTTMQNYKDDMRIIGEQILHSQGKGLIRKASRLVEEVSFKYLMGAPDALSKMFAFNDTADLLATKLAKEEGAKDVSKRATEIYNDAINIKPLTKQGQKVREQAQEQAHYTTFTNDSWASKFGLKAREYLNMVGRDKIRLGDLTMKFVKTPANVASMGLEYGFGLMNTAYHIPEIYKTLTGKATTEEAKRASIGIRAGFRNGLGIALTMFLYAMLDPEDYYSEFDDLNPKERDLMKAQGAMPNSVKIGGKWVSLDYFGQMGVPFVAMLEARKRGNLRNYVQSGLMQVAKIPGIKEIKDLITSISEYAKYDLPPEKIAKMMANTVLDQARAMTIPAIVNDIAKMVDNYERDTSGGVFDRVQASIPLLRERLPQRYTLSGTPLETESAVSTLLAGSRIKTAKEDKLVREVGKLSRKGEQPSISDVTKYGDLRLLSPEKKTKVRKEFYKEYGKESKKAISSISYINADAEDKKKILNKVRSNIVKELKTKYSKDIKREKGRR